MWARRSPSASASPPTSQTQAPEAGRDLVALIDHVEALVVHTESEALLAEQNFIKQYKPRFNIRLRDDKSYPYIAISLDEEFPRVYFTRERHRRDRAYFGPYSNAKRVRSTLEVLGKVFMFRTCEGPEPGRRSGSPCLDYYIKRCEAPCVGYVSAEHYRQGIDGVIGFLSGRYREIERKLDREMRQASAEQRFEDAARERNRLRAVRSLLERQRVANEATGTLDAVAVAVDTRRGQRPGLPGARRGALGPAELLSGQRGRRNAGRGCGSLHPSVLRERDVDSAAACGAGGASRDRRARKSAGREARRSCGDSRPRARRQAPHPGARAAQCPPRVGPRATAVGAPAPTARRGTRRPAASARVGDDPATNRMLRHLHAHGHEHGRLHGRLRRWRAQALRLQAVQGLHQRRRERGRDDRPTR